MDPFKTGKIIMNARKKCNMTQKELATKLFVSDKAVSKWERGLSFPDIALLIPLSDILNVNLYELLKGEEMKEKQDDTILKETIKYSSEEKSKLKKFLISIIILMSIAIIIMIGFIIIAKLPKQGVQEEKIIPGEKFSIKNYVGPYKTASKELSNGWICKMEIYYLPDWAIEGTTDYSYNCVNIKYKELLGFNYYNFNTYMNKYYLDDMNYPSYMHNTSYRNELNQIYKYFKEHKFNETITINDLDKLNLKLIDKDTLVEVYNKAINSELIDSYGNYPNSFHGVFNYEYTSYETGETYVVGFYLDIFGYIRNIYIDTKNGDYYNRDLIDKVNKYNTSNDDKKYILKQLLNKKDKFDKIEDYIISNQTFSIPENLKDDSDAIELMKYHFQVINGLINNKSRTGNIIRYVKDEKEMDNQEKEVVDYFS